jgi:hypothetical protein
MSYLMLLPPTPIPDPRWLYDFTAHLVRLRPELDAQMAMKHARLAHGATFLLDACEGAQLWDQTMRVHNPHWSRDE